MQDSEAYAQVPAQNAAQAWRYVVAQATGVLMARFRIGSEAAFGKLATMATKSNRPIVVVAREIVEDVNGAASANGKPNGVRRHLRPAPEREPGQLT
jgi:AmiR/NasT family two-component response regulator